MKQKMSFAQRLAFSSKRPHEKSERLSILFLNSFSRPYRTTFFCKKNNMTQEEKTRNQLIEVIKQLNEKNSQEVLAYAKMLQEIQRSDESLLQKIAPLGTNKEIN